MAIIIIFNIVSNSYVTLTHASANITVTGLPLRDMSATSGAVLIVLMISILALIVKIIQELNSE